MGAFSPRKLNALEWTWFVGFGFLALMGERYVIWFVLILMLLTSLMLADWEKRILGEPKQGSPALNLVLCLAFVLLPLALLFWWSRRGERSAAFVALALIGDYDGLIVRSATRVNR